MRNKREAAKVLAKTIDERTTEVRDALFDSGVKITPNADKSDLVVGILENLGTNRRLQKQIGSLALEVSPQSFDKISDKKSRGRQKKITGFYSQDGQSGQVGQQAIQTGGQIAGILLANFLANRQSQKQAEIDAQTAETQQRLLLANQQLVEANLALENTKLAQASLMTPTNQLLIGILFVAALGAGLYFMQKNKVTCASTPKLSK